jgi:hypothetical protein
VDTVLLDELVQTDYGQFDLVYSDDGGFNGDWTASSPIRRTAS